MSFDTFRLFPHGRTPRLRPLSPRRSDYMTIVDVGTSKFSVMIAEFVPDYHEDAPYSHKIQLLGVGHRKAHGIKCGAIVDAQLAERTLRACLESAERMAGVEVQSVVVSISAGRIKSHRVSQDMVLTRPSIRGEDVDWLITQASKGFAQQGRVVLHSIPTQFTLDGVRGVLDPVGLKGQHLSAEIHVVDADAAAVANVLSLLDRMHLGVEACVAAPYASALSVLRDDDIQLGATVIDLGAGVTSLAIFGEGRCQHMDCVAVGSGHITTDIARGLGLSLSDAERLKVLFGSAMVDGVSDHEHIPLPGMSDTHDAPYVTKGYLNTIISARVEEIFEFIQNRLNVIGFRPGAEHSVVLTGGGCQLTGLAHVASRTIGGTTRLVKPFGIEDLPEAAEGAQFSTSVGLLKYWFVSGIEGFDVHPSVLNPHADKGLLSQMSHWLMESF